MTVRGAMALIVTSMVAVSFGSYATALFFGDDASAVWVHVFTSGIVIAVAAINILGSSLVDRVQSLVVDRCSVRRGSR